jgi:uncharacterized protein (UPF0548 family)
MIRLRPDLRAALERARSLEPLDEGWSLDDPPPGADVLDRWTDVPDGADLEAAARALRDWGVHRGAGLRVAADGPARPGSDVVLGIGLGPLWALAPCRVVDASGLGFTYAALPGHPEAGLERFEYVRDERGARFHLRAVSRPAWRTTRLVPAAALRVQAAVTTRYLRAGVDLAAATL